MKQIVIVSGKGGTGKTSLTASLARISSNTVIADCDVDASNLHLLLDPEYLRSEKFYSGSHAFIDKDKCTKCDKCVDVCIQRGPGSSETVGLCGGILQGAGFSFVEGVPEKLALKGIAGRKNTDDFVDAVSYASQYSHEALPACFA